MDASPLGAATPKQFSPRLRGFTHMWLLRRGLIIAVLAAWVGCANSDETNADPNGVRGVPPSDAGGLGGPPSSSAGGDAATIQPRSQTDTSKGTAGTTPESIDAAAHDAADASTGDATSEDGGSTPDASSDAGRFSSYRLCPYVDPCGSYQSLNCPATPQTGPCDGTYRQSLCNYCLPDETEPSKTVTCPLGVWEHGRPPLPCMP